MVAASLTHSNPFNKVSFYPGKTKATDAYNPAPALQRVEDCTRPEHTTAPLSLKAVRTLLKNGDKLVFHPKLKKSCMTVQPPAWFDRTDPTINALLRLLQVGPEENYKEVLIDDRTVTRQLVQWIPIVEDGKSGVNLWCDNKGALAPDATRNVLAESYFGRFVHGSTLYGTIVIM